MGSVQSNRFTLSSHEDQSSSSSSASDGCSYGVFLSFRGKDTRNNFTGHLYAALQRAGITTFIDDDKLEQGQEIDPSLLKAIEESKIYIPVFSRNYAFSAWCLEELAAMVECKEKNGQTLLPIFLDVDPSDVRHQTGSFDEAFHHHKYIKNSEEEKMKRWRGALAQAGNSSGWDLKEVANGHESKLIPLVVKAVLRKLHGLVTDDINYPVGVDSYVEVLLHHLQIQSSSAQFVGISGMGGIGKTTIAKAIFNKLHNVFQCSCFLENIREVAFQTDLVTLQRQLLDNIDEGNEGIYDVNKGNMVIKARFKYKNVLLVLDDVDDKKQLDALAGNPDWFGSGSRIIITTRDQHLLKIHLVDLIYEPDKLGFDQSLQLFSKHAFCVYPPPKEYMELSEQVLCCAGGLPLVLEVLGSFLYDKDIEEWKCALVKLKKIPDDNVQERLRLSYEGLDDSEKATFLDIACFFIGMDTEIAIGESSGFFSRIGIEVLRHKSLVKIDEKNKLRMHDIIRDMGREIVRQENSKMPGMRSRLFIHEEALHVLEEQKGTKHIEGLNVDFRQQLSESTMQTEIRSLSTKAFAPMLRLRLLRVNYANLEGDLKHLSKHLRWLSWNGCPFQYLPKISHLEELVVLDLRYSNVKQDKNCLHQNKLLLKKLKVLDLRGCDSLTTTPDLSGLPCLERLILMHCSNLVEVDESIGNLKNLVFLNLEGCTKLTKLPNSICELKRLKTLVLTNCTEFCELPENLGAMESLSELLADHTSVSKVPHSIGFLKNLKRFYFECCRERKPRFSLKNRIID